MRRTFVVLVWFCITLATFYARITTICLYLPKLSLKHYWSHFFPDTVYYCYYYCYWDGMGLAMINLHTKFEVSVFTHHEDRKGNAKYRNWGSFEVTQCHHLIDRIQLRL